MPADPFAQEIEPPVLDCNDPTHDSCHLDRLPGESHVDHVARIKARFADNPDVVETVPGRHTAVSQVTSCSTCGRFRGRGYPCAYCDRIPIGRLA